MVCQTEGIRVLAPERWRSLDGVMSVYWDAEGMAGAHGYYLSPDPRIVFFFNDVSPHIRMSDRKDGFGRRDRPMTRAIYVPAGQPLWTSFTSRHRFSHLDLHIHESRLMRFLQPSLGTSAARSVLQTPVELHDVASVEALAALLTREVSVPTRHAVYAESLVGSIDTGILDLSLLDDERQAGQLTQSQMNRLVAQLEARGDLRLSVTEMAETVGLSESWFGTVFKQTVGKTPLQWQMAKRVERAKELLRQPDLSVADTAVQLGFSDQAHFTKAFRQVCGQTPAAWRKKQSQR